MNTYINRFMHFIAGVVTVVLFYITICVLGSGREFNISSYVECFKEHFNLEYSNPERKGNESPDNSNLEICVHCKKSFDRSQEFRMFQDTDPAFTKYRNYCQNCFASIAKREKEIYEKLLDTYERILGEQLR